MQAENRVHHVTLSVDGKRWSTIRVLDRNTVEACQKAADKLALGIRNRTIRYHVTHRIAAACNGVVRYATPVAATLDE
jgi:hypothetical protein